MKQISLTMGRGVLALAAICASTGVQAVEKDLLFRQVVSDPRCGGCGGGPSASLLSDGRLVAGRITGTPKSGRGEAVLWDASVHGQIKELWREPTGTWSNGTFEYYAPGGPIAGSIIQDLDAQGNFLLSHHLEPGSVAIGSMGASAFNDQMLVVGESYALPGSGAWIDYHAGTQGNFQIDGMQALMPLEVNNDKLVVGSGKVNGQSQAFVFDLQAGSGRALFDPAQVNASAFLDLNNHGSGLGYRVGADGMQTMFLYDAQSGQITDLDVPANAVGKLNDAGQIVVGSRFFDGVNWVDLKAVSGLEGDVTALDINNHGDILMRHRFNYDLQTNAGGFVWQYSTADDYYILSAVPEASSFLLFGLGAFGLIWATKRRRHACAMG